jgi:hypothetical protein
VYPLISRSRRADGPTTCHSSEAHPSAVKTGRGLGSREGVGTRCYETALEWRTREADPSGLVNTSNNLAMAYAKGPGDEERAIECYQRALEVGTREFDARGRASMLAG